MVRFVVCAGLHNALCSQIWFSHLGLRQPGSRNVDGTICPWSSRMKRPASGCDASFRQQPSGRLPRDGSNGLRCDQPPPIYSAQRCSGPMRSDTRPVLTIMVAPATPGSAREGTTAKPLSGVKRRQRKWFQRVSAWRPGAAYLVGFQGYPIRDTARPGA